MKDIDELIAIREVDISESPTKDSAYDAGFYEGVCFILSLYEHQDSIQQFEQEAEKIRAVAEDMHFKD